MNHAIFLHSNENSNGTSSYLSKRFTKPLDLKGLKWNISLYNLSMTLSWWNVSSSLGNDKLRYYSPNSLSYVEIDLEDGHYTAQTLFTHIQDKLKLTADFTPPATYPISFAIDLSDGVVSMFISAGFKVDFTGNGAGLGTLLGFDNVEYVADAVAPRNANIRNNIEQLHIRCDAISGNSTLNGSYSNILYSFNPVGEPNESIQISPNFPLKVGVNSSSQLESISVYITNQNGQVIDLKNRPVSVTLLLEPVL